MVTYRTYHIRMKVRTAQWMYDSFYKEEKHAREYGATDLWYIRESRLDAGSALRIARGVKETPRWELPRVRCPVYRKPLRCHACGWFACKCDDGPVSLTGYCMSV